MDLIEKHPWRVYFAYLALVSVGYAVASHAPRAAPFVIEASALDQRIPFAAWAAVPYLSYLLLLPALLAWMARRPGFSFVAATGMCCGLANVVVYWLVPTRVAFRPPAPADSLLSLVQHLDTPLCAFPSGHVALPVSLAVAALLVGWRRAASLFFGWALLLGASALLTKQHYLVDVAGGAAFGLMTAGGCAALFRARAALHVPTLRAFALEWSLLAITALVTLAWWKWWVVAAAMIVIATRQHALLVLYHDGVHKLVARSLRVNDFLVNLAVGAPMLMPVHLYRALHVVHHQHLGTAKDPERSLLYRDQPWRYRPLATRALLWQVAGDVLLWNALRLAWRYFEQGAARGPAARTRSKLRPEVIVPQLLVAGVWIAGALASPSLAGQLALLWFVPYLTLTPALNKLRSFCEHAGGDDEWELTFSWAPGVLGRLTVWPYNINFHREHHAHPRVPWNELPVVFSGVRQRPGRELLARVWAGVQA